MARLAHAQVVCGTRVDFGTHRIGKLVMDPTPSYHHIELPVMAHAELPVMPVSGGAAAADKAYRTSQLLTHPIFHLLLILQNSAEQATKGRQVCNARRGDLRMHRPLR